MQTFRTCVSTWVRRALARRLMAWALRLLPRTAPESQALRKALPEARAYERYEAYTRLQGEQPIPFDKWRGERRWMTALRKGGAVTLRFPSRLVVR